MARQKAPDFLERLYDAALRVFTSKGLAKARMSDVADAMGVAHGSLYNYVESKEALFYFLVEQGVRRGPIELPDELPLKAPTETALLARLKEQIASSFALPELDRALKRRAAADPAAEVEAIVGELYARIGETRQAGAVIERAALDLPELFRVYFLGVRRELFEKMATYVRMRLEAGQLAATEDPAVVARFVVESVAFFASHRYQDPAIPPGDDDEVREAVVALLVRALVGPAKTKTRR